MFDTVWTVGFMVFVEEGNVYYLYLKFALFIVTYMPQFLFSALDSQ